MTDIIKKSDVSTWDPWRAMRDLMRWDPFREMAPTYSTFERATFAPTFDVSENKDAYMFKADVPGVKKEDLEISINGNRLCVSGKRDWDHETKSDTYYAYEREYGSFSRTFTLPDGADYEHVKSSLDNGVLSLWIPKKPESQAKKIAISSGTKS